MSEPKRSVFLSAVDDFRRARRRAALEDILARLAGRPADLLSYEDASQSLRAAGTVPRGLQEVPLDAIVGSVGRYADFSRSFLPRQVGDEERWASVKVRALDRGGLPPIKVYQIGQAYFVLDGNHRVSVARQLGLSRIPAHVIEVRTKVPLSPADRPDDLILKAEYTDFLECTRLDELRPGANLSTTVPGQYQALLEQIAYHRRFMGVLQGRVHPREFSFEEAVAHWYDEVYLPVVRVIRERGVLRDFPGRTETDLHVWVSEHRAALEEDLGWDIRPQEAAEHLVEVSSRRPKHVLARAGERILDVLTPRRLRAGPPPGHWRQEHVAGRHETHLFGEILVAVNGQASGWEALDQALEVARREQGRVYGLHVVPRASQLESAAVEAVRGEFERRCQAAAIPGQLAAEAGPVAQTISQRGRWADLVVVSVSYPPPHRPSARLSSGMSNLLRDCPRPVLAVPRCWCQLDRALLAYDGSPKSDEALFVATYLALQWQMPLVVVTVAEHSSTAQQTLGYARDYLADHEVQATLVHSRGPAAEALLQAAEEQRSSLLIMGGYGLRPVLEVLLGSTVDRMLRTSNRPILVCR